MMNFPDYPSTGQTYSNYKWDGEKWMPLPATFADAPSDSKTYGRKDQTWAEIIAAVLEAPITGKIYGRKDATWAEIISDVTKAYVDTQDALRVLKTGDTMSGILTATVLKTTSGAAAQFGGTSPLGFHVDATNVAIRTPPGGAIYFQGNTGTPNFGSWNSSTLSVATALSVGGALGVGGQIAANGGFTVPSNVGCQLYNNGVYYASAAASSIQVQGPPYPTISFHCAGYFGANFGMATDGEFWMGGWSHGEGVAYRFWTTRNFGNIVTEARTAYQGDYSHAINTGLAEPYGAQACITALSGFDNYGSFSYTARYRQLQYNTPGGWAAFGAV